MYMIMLMNNVYDNADERDEIDIYSNVTDKDEKKIITRIKK